MSKKRDFTACPALQRILERVGSFDGPVTMAATPPPYREEAKTPDAEARPERDPVRKQA